MWKPADNSTRKSWCGLSIWSREEGAVWVLWGRQQVNGAEGITLCFFSVLLETYNCLKYNFMLKITLDLIYRFIGKQGSEQEAHESRGPVSPDFLR